jgi:hypothetical protein
MDDARSPTGSVDRCGAFWSGVTMLPRRPARLNPDPLLSGAPFRAAAVRRNAGVALLAIPLAVATLLWWLHPIAAGRDYLLGLEITSALFVVWLAWAARPSFMSRRLVLVAIAVAGSLGSAGRALGLDANAEVIRTYRSLFVALSHDTNPYTCHCIVHYTPHGLRLGAFNYPPAEIWPYEAVQWLMGSWDVAVLAVTLVCCNAIAFSLLFFAAQRGRRLWMLAFLPFLVLWELQTTIALTMLVTGAIVALLLVDMRVERGWHRLTLWGLFGIGLLTKFAVIPLFAVWWWWTTVARVRAARGPSPVPRRGALAAAADVLVPVSTALALCLPFGLANVLHSTFLFNVQLDQRAKLTTYYPNVVSGLLSWAGLEWIFPVLAVGAMATVVFLAPRFRILTAMLLATTVFLLVSPTPEPQYLPVVVLLLLGALLERGSGEPLTTWSPLRAGEVRPAPAVITPGTTEVT